MKFYNILASCILKVNILYTENNLIVLRFSKIDYNRNCSGHWEKTPTFPSSLSKYLKSIVLTGEYYNGTDRG